MLAFILDWFCLKWFIVSAIPEGFWFYFVAAGTYRLFTIDVQNRCYRKYETGEI